MSMEKHECKLCSKKFLSGKALGGHMRSHLIPLPLPPKTPPLNQDSGGRSESTLSLCSSENQEEQEQVGEETDFYYGLRENPKKSFKIIDPEFLDRESETNRRRSERSRKMVESEEKNRPLSLFSDSSSEEDIALCLMMLSRDVWKNSKQNGKKLYQCWICHKMFKTSQALGSHKTIHKNKFNSYEEEAQEKPSKKKFVSVKNIVDQKHECPFCGKFFQSGQALGGHKRTHLVIMSSSTTASSSSSKLGDSLMEYSISANLPNGFIDLNMPAPVEDNDFSPPDFSAVKFQQEQELA